MRKVLEITFSGEDFRVISADTSAGALAKLSENPNIFVVDTVLGGEDGYNLAKELRKRNPSAPIIMLASRYAPYDQARGRDAGADDWADKPFDTQQLLDKIRKVVLAREAGGPAPQPAAAPPPPPAAPAFRAPSQSQPQQPVAAAASPGGSLARGTQQSLGGSVPHRSGTLVFGEAPLAAPAPPPPAAPPPVAARPLPPPPAAPPPPAPPPAATPAHGTPAHGIPAAAAGHAHVANAVNGQLAGKLGDLGLTPAQADAVLALSREVVERVVWEVVPQLAEAIIKEEIVRLTR